jgi:translocator protein
MPYIPYLTFPPFFFSSPIASTLLPFALGIGPGIITRLTSSSAANERFANEESNKYLSLKQPPLSPPAWAFPVVWTVLYPLMGYAAHRAWTVGLASADTAVRAQTESGATLYTAQLAVNLCFSTLFFTLGRSVEGLVNIATLTGMVGYLAYIWIGVDQTAAYCLVPYIAWLGFATYLCAGLGYLNDWDLKFDKVGKEPKVE